ncbi:MAG: membrane protein of unknown function [Candidatus Thorarchaeota archaeon]|nr:MAG: membrane protein of unknown function [Candidatus Thorarchaeota archaeon]
MSSSLRGVLTLSNLDRITPILILLSGIFFPMMYMDWTSTLTSDASQSLYFVWGGLNLVSFRIGLYGPTQFGALDSSYLILLSAAWISAVIILSTLFFVLESVESIGYLTISSLALVVIFAILPHLFVENAVLPNFQVISLVTFPFPPLFSVIAGFVRYRILTSST